MADDARRYRFGPLERRGLVGSLRPLQVFVLAAAMTLGVLLMRLLPTGVGVLAALALVGFLYYRPVKAYVRAQAALEERAAEVRQLTAERTTLRRRLRLDVSGATLVREARRLGLVRPDERLFIIKGIDAWQRARAAARADERD